MAFGADAAFWGHLDIGPTGGGIPSSNPGGRVEQRAGIECMVEFAGPFEPVVFDGEGVIKSNVLNLQMRREGVHSSCGCGRTTDGHLIGDYGDGVRGTRDFSKDIIGNPAGRIQFSRGEQKVPVGPGGGAIHIFEASARSLGGG